MYHIDKHISVNCGICSVINMEIIRILSVDQRNLSDDSSYVWGNYVKEVMIKPYLN